MTVAARGIPDSQIKILGHWKSSAFQCYLQLSDGHVANLAAQLSQDADGPPHNAKVGQRLGVTRSTGPQ